MRTIQIAFTGVAATANAVAQVTIPGRCKLKQVQWAVYDTYSGADGAATLQLSKASASELTVNGAQQAISNVAIEVDLVTSGLGHGAVNFVHPVEVDLDQGQILYLHAAVANLTLAGHLILYTT